MVNHYVFFEEQKTNKQKKKIKTSSFNSHFVRRLQTLAAKYISHRTSQSLEQNLVNSFILKIHNHNVVSVTLYGTRQTSASTLCYRIPHFPPCISSSLQNCTGSGSTLAFMLIQMTINRAAFRVGPKKRTECKSDVPGKTELVVSRTAFKYNRKKEWKCTVGFVCIRFTVAGEFNSKVAAWAFCFLNADWQE